MLIKLTQDKYAIIDDEDFKLVDQYKWHVLKTSVNNYAATNAGGRKNRKYILMHKLILDYFGFSDIDHINGNALDNRKQNLRICSRQQNIRNKKKCNKICSSQYKGVWFRKDTQKWSSEITVDYKKICLGCFVNEVDAAKAYNEVAREYFGKFAKLNIMGD